MNTLLQIFGTYIFILYAGALVWASWKVYGVRFAAMLRKWNVIPCECGCRDTYVGREFKIDTYGPVCEYEILCKACKKQVNYWAYGYIQFPETYTELMQQKIYHARNNLKHLLKKDKLGILPSWGIEKKSKKGDC